MNSATLAAAALKAQRQLEGLSSAPRNRLPRIENGNLGRTRLSRSGARSASTVSRGIMGGGFIPPEMPSGVL